jgi:hypothetical protein
VTCWVSPHTCLFVPVLLFLDPKRAEFVYMCTLNWTEQNKTILSIYSGKIVSLNICILAIIPDMIFVIISMYFNSWFVIWLLLLCLHFCRCNCTYGCWAWQLAIRIGIIIIIIIIITAVVVAVKTVTTLRVVWKKNLFCFASGCREIYLCRSVHAGSGGLTPLPPTNVYWQMFPRG